MADFYVEIHYSAGRAGAGWSKDRERNVRVPHVTLEGAERTFEAYATGTYGDPESCSYGIIPDSVRLVDYTPQGIPLPGRTLRWFRRTEDGVSCG